jgi:2-C-methyl-D-erythritol 4-phosphate cytidylyltransferase
MKKYALIVAGGSGIRIGLEVPKQFIEITGKPIIIHTCEAFINAFPDIEFIVVMNPKWHHLWQKVLSQFPIMNPLITTDGGPTRFHSVKNGLGKISDDLSIVGIHDAVRPLVNKDVIHTAYKEAEVFGNAIPVVPVYESIRIKNGPFNEPVDRNKLIIVQTPQCFQTALIKDAYRQNYDERFTDDALVLESTGERIRLVAGNIENIKITKPSDIRVAETFMMHRSDNF